MKGLLLAVLFVIAIIGVGIGLSAFAHVNYIDDVAVAGEGGFNEGFARGYEDGLREGSEAGYQEGSKAVYAQSERIDDENLDAYYIMYNPTYDEVIDILAEEELDTFEKIHDYALSNGIRVGYVRCRVTLEAPEAKTYIYHLAIFDTVDRGPLIIEPWSHRVVKVETGEEYRGLYEPVEPGVEGIVNKVTVVW